MHNASLEATGSLHVKYFGKHVLAGQKQGPDFVGRMEW
jgi:hypothetical protein